MIYVQFSGDLSEWDAKVKADLEGAFNRREFHGLVEVTLANTAGRGYQILRATRWVPAVGVGEDLGESTTQDYSAEIRERLIKLGVPLA